MPAIPAIITGGASIAGSAIAAHGNTSAAKTQAGSDAAALAQAKEIYEQQRQDQGPYRESGYGAMDALNFGLGLPTVQRPGTSATPKPISTVSGLEFPGAAQMPAGVLSTVNRLAQSNSPVGKLMQTMQGKLTNAQQIVNDKYGTPGATVKIKAPNGFIYLVGNDQVEAAKAKGGVVV